MYRHSTAHLLAAAVTNLFPDVQCGIGPATDEGFFYDFVVPRPFVPEDLEAIEKKMKALASQDLPYERQMWPREEAIRFFRDRGEPLKVQLIEEKTAGSTRGLLLHDQGPRHVRRFLRRPARAVDGASQRFKLLSTSNAYWKGDAHNQPMQRVYGTAFFSDKDLQTHLQRIEEAKKRDHRKLGRDLGLFIGPSVGARARPSGSAKGRHSTTRSRITCARCSSLPVTGSEDADHLQQSALGDVRSLVALSREHVPRQVADDEEMALKAMNCPGHFLVFASEMRSYKDLPLRFHEQTPLHRNEASGVLSGLTRVRQFSQDDAHCFVMESQIAEEVERLLRLVQRVYRDFGLPYTVKLSTRPEKFLGSVATWDHAEGSLKKALEAANQAYVVNQGMARSTARSSTSTSPTPSAASGSARRFSSIIKCRSASI